MYICRLWCQCSFKHLFFHFLGRWSNLTSSSFRSHQNFLVSMILRGNVARETDASTDLCPFWNPFSSLLVANGFKERAWHPGIQSKLGLLQKGLGWRLWLFDFLCNLYGFADLHRFGDKPTSKPTSFLFSLCFLFLWGGGVLKEIKFKNQNIIYQVHSLAGTVSCRIFQSECIYLFSKNRKWRSIGIPSSARWFLQRILEKWNMEVEYHHQINVNQIDNEKNPQDSDSQR